MRVAVTGGLAIGRFGDELDLDLEREQVQIHLQRARGGVKRMIVSPGHQRALKGLNGLARNPFRQNGIPVIASRISQNSSSKRNGVEGMVSRELE